MNRTLCLATALSVLVATHGIAAAMDRCILLTAGEAAAAVGGPVGPGYAAGPMQTACQWDGTADAAAYVQVQVIEDPGDWSPPTLADGYTELAGTGEKAYVLPEMGGFAAGALDRGLVVAVSLAGEGASAESAGSLLRLVVARLRGG